MKVLTKIADFKELVMKMSENALAFFGRRTTGLLTINTLLCIRTKPVNDCISPINPERL